MYWNLPRTNFDKVMMFPSMNIYHRVFAQQHKPFPTYQIKVLLITKLVPLFSPLRIDGPLERIKLKHVMSATDDLMEGMGPIVMRRSALSHYRYDALTRRYLHYIGKEVRSDFNTIARD
jgi:hypothetical protein